MLKKLLLLCVAILSLSASLASAVEVNTADETALESVKGIGPVHAKAIIDERTKNGPFKDADDLATRVKGIGTKSVVNLEAAGLTINGSSAPPAGKSSKAVSQAPATKAGENKVAPAATTTAAAPADASGGKASKKRKKAKDAEAASGAAATTAATTATAPASASGASDAKASKKKSKKSKAASAAAASGG